MLLFLLVLGAAASIYLVRRSGVLSPAAVTSLFATITLLQFWLVVDLRVYPQYVQGFRYVEESYHAVRVQVALYLVVVSLLAVLARQLAERSELGRAKQAMLSGLGLRSFRYSSFGSIKLAPWMYFFVGALVVLLVCHSIFADWALLYEHTVYLMVRDPVSMGMDGTLLGYLHRLVLLVGFVLLGFFSLALFKKDPLLSSLAFIGLLYCFVIAVAFNSRTAALYLAVLALLIFSGGKRARLISVGLGALALATYFAVLIPRRIANTYGINAFLESFGYIGEVGQLALFALYNSFGGGFVVAEALQSPDLYYPIKYKILSFSPFPSLIDGFDDVREQGHRISVFAPYGGLSEALLFGWQYVVFFYTAIFWMLYSLEKGVVRTGNDFLMLALPIILYINSRLYVYPLRQLVRWMFLAVTVSWFFTRYKGRGRKVGRSLYNEAG